ncbi:mrr restriction system protein [Deinococcus carri]|uniref:Mrr restriction system protein n=1 Tax=Deinococcus carri TaxID=1211323 RepID=A0ABP9W6G9_9DEIO
MAVPDYQTFMRPLLKLLADGTTQRMRDIYAALATEFQLTESEMAELLPSGRQPTYMNRIGWAKTYLLKAGALESSQRGWVQVTERGRELLRTQPEINARTLTAFAEFQEFQGTGAVQAPTQAAPLPDAAASPNTLLSPEEQLAALYAELNKALAAELLSQVQELTPAQFERLVVEVLLAMGYGGSMRDAGQALGRSGDNGIDGLIKQDPLGLDRIYLQAKKWQNPVHSPEIRTFAGSLTYHKASKGVFLTTSTFSDGARTTAQQIGNIILIDGPQLAQLMIEYGVGVDIHSTYHVKRVNSGFFEEL